jgi:hypothetical protein
MRLRMMPRVLLTVLGVVLATVTGIFFIPWAKSSPADKGDPVKAKVIPSHLVFLMLC